jgi:hypothetical protein
MRKAWIVGAVIALGGCTSGGSDPGSSGSSGSGTSSSSGSSGSGSTGGGAAEIAAELDGLRWALPCVGAPVDAYDCAAPRGDGGGSAVSVSTVLTGTPGQRYAVELRFVGAIEQRTYYAIDGGPAPEGGLAVGALPDGGDNPQFLVTDVATPGLDDTYNIYELDISDPPQTYFLNSGASHVGQLWPIDYAATLQMSAGATVTMIADSVEGYEILNIDADAVTPVIAPGFDAGYDGQFIQMNVVSVVADP